MGKSYVPAPSRKWSVKFEHKDDPIIINASSKYQLKQIIAKRYAICGCGCDEPPEVESINEVLGVA